MHNDIEIVSTTFVQRANNNENWCAAIRQPVDAITTQHFVFYDNFLNIEKIRSFFLHIITIRSQSIRNRVELTLNEVASSAFAAASARSGAANRHFSSARAAPRASDRTNSARAGPEAAESTSCWTPFGSHHAPLESTFFAEDARAWSWTPECSHSQCRKSRRGEWRRACGPEISPSSDDWRSSAPGLCAEIDMSTKATKSISSPQPQSSHVCPPRRHLSVRRWRGGAETETTRRSSVLVLFLLCVCFVLVCCAAVLSDAIHVGTHRNKSRKTK